ncbi:chaplin [Streptomyces sp. SGAir0957]
MRLRVFAAAAVLAGTTVLGSAAMASAHGSDGPDGATAVGNAQNSPGVLSGNNIQVPVNLQANVCGVGVDVLALLNPTSGECAND